MCFEKLGSLFKMINVSAYLLLSIFSEQNVLSLFFYDLLLRGLHPCQTKKFIVDPKLVEIKPQIITTVFVLLVVCSANIVIYDASK